MKKSLYLIAALTLMGTNIFANTAEIKEESLNEETQLLTSVEAPVSTWSFTGRTYLETENFDNSSKIVRGDNQMKSMGKGDDAVFWGTGIAASKDKLTLDLNVERRYIGGAYSFKDGTNDRTRVDYKVRYQLLDKQGFHVKYRNEKGNGFRRDRFELGTDWNYFDNLFAGWFVVGHDIDKTAKRSKGNYWEGDFGPTFKLTEKLSLNPTLYTTGEFYDSYEMVETQLRIMTPYQVNDKLTVMPRIRITLDRTQDEKVTKAASSSFGDFKRSYDTGLNRLRYELMANYVINDQFSTFVGVAYENGKRDFKNSDLFGGKDGKETLNMWWGYVGLNYKFN
ncbi:MAG: hypothetical protein ACRC1R_08415 [Cetobacterium sp.]|uniref:hypothetical protein n=1 Tax=Cetobacterium sp. TaxID=2071632 RepID=UPI003F2E4A2A